MITLDVVRNGHVNLLWNDAYNNVKTTMYIDAVIKLDGLDFHVQFVPSDHISNPENIWKLKRFVEDADLSRMLGDNQFTIDAELIERVMDQCEMSFWLSKDKKQMFPTPFEIFEEEHGPLEKISARQALDLIPLPALEVSIERGSPIILAR
jgi:hypothetical protein